MNLLAHAYLADRSTASLFGNLMADFLKGVDLSDCRHGARVKQGIRLHREVDAYTDAHEVVQLSRKRMGPGLRHYSGAVIDLFYDHFLARHWYRYGSEAMERFVHRAYSAVETHSDCLPAGSRAISGRMMHEDWLLSYREIVGIRRAVDRVAARAKRKEVFGSAADGLSRHYSELESDFLAFFPDLIAHTERLR